QVNWVFHIRRGDVGDDEYHLQRAAMVMVFRWERHFCRETCCVPALPGWLSSHCVAADAGLRPCAPDVGILSPRPSLVACHPWRQLCGPSLRDVTNCSCNLLRCIARISSFTVIACGHGS